MKEYIKREFIDNLLQKHLDDWCGPEYYVTSIIQDEIDEFPAADVVEVKHSHWEYWAGNLARCPVCGYEYTDLLECDNYCGNCGAKMDGGKV